MLRAASSAPSRLLEANPRVAEFLRGQFNEDGGAQDRSGNSDLYYTVFALDGLLALGVDPPVEAARSYLSRFEDGERLDLVHRACLVRCWAALPGKALDDERRRRLASLIEAHRSADGGYSSRADAATGTVYGCFLALGAYQDLGAEPPAPQGLVRCLGMLRAADGAFAGERGLELGTTPATAAAVILLSELGEPVPPTLGQWLLARCQAEGGFLATPRAPFPDLLSTATALHALARMGVSLDAIREPCLDFLDSLWTGQAFRGHWADSVADSEYAFYALLALGHLSS